MPPLKLIGLSAACRVSANGNPDRQHEIKEFPNSTQSTTAKRAVCLLSREFKRRRGAGADWPVSIQQAPAARAAGGCV